MISERIWIISGGASGCRVAVVSKNGGRLGQNYGGATDLAWGAKPAWDNISRAMRQLASKLHFALPWQEQQRVAICIEGVNDKINLTAFRAQIPAGVDLRIASHGYGNLLGAFGGAAGTCLTVGNGSIVHSFDTNGHHRVAGGWGFPIGDAGSGAWLGWRVAQALVASVDSGKVASWLRPAVDIFGSNRSDIQRWAAQAKANQYASAVPMLINAAQTGSLEASKILLEGADCLMDLAKLVHDPALPICLCGDLAPVFASLLSERFPARWQPPVGDVLAGALLLALDQVNSDIK